VILQLIVIVVEVNKQLVAGNAADLPEVDQHHIVLLDQVIKVISVALKVIELELGSGLGHCAACEQEHHEHQHCRDQSDHSCTSRENSSIYRSVSGHLICIIRSSEMNERPFV